MLDRVHGGDVKRHIVDFSANINPFGLSPKARAAIIKNIAGVIHYPEPDSRSLKQALADFHGVKQDNLTVGNGSIELIHLIPKALKAKKILIVTPAFSEYEFSARSNGSKIVFVRAEERGNFRIGLKKIQRFLSRVDLVFLGNPNNPTGSCLHSGELSSLAGACARHKALLAVDEVFMDFVETREKDSLLSAAPGNRHLLVLRSLTKFFALPGLRLGYAAGHRDIVRRLSGLQYPWNINSLAQAAGKETLKDTGYMDHSRRYIEKEREYLFGGLKDIKGLKAFSPTSNFIFCKLESCAIKSAKVLNEELIKRGLAVRDCGNFRGLDEKFFRAAVRKRNENRRLITSLKEVL